VRSSRFCLTADLFFITTKETPYQPKLFVYGPKTGFLRIADSFLKAGFYSYAELVYSIGRFVSMKLNLIKKSTNLFLYLIPTTENTAHWEIIDKEELERRTANNELVEDGRIFEIAKERKIRTEKSTYLE